MSGEQQTALVIDDDNNVNDIITRLLEREGYKVTSVFDGKAGLTAVKDGDFSIVITDILMPGHEGVTVLREIKNMGKKCKVVVVSGALERDDYLKTAQDFGADAIIAKPILVKEFREVIAGLK